MNAQHTPGPWTISEQLTSGYVEIDAKLRWYALAQVATQTNGTVCAEGQANARLIAAAPELLAACRAIVETYAASLPGRYDFVDLARAAIAKAEGTTP